MKKVLLLLLLCMPMIAASQGTWEKITLEADELKGQQGGDVMIYTDAAVGSFVFWNWDEYQFRLTSDHAQFNINVSNGHTGLLVFVGIYNDNGDLTDKFQMWLDREDNHGNTFLRTRNAGVMSNPVGQKKKVKKIFNALKSDRGYIRIVAERYNTSDFDLKITPFKE